MAYYCCECLIWQSSTDTNRYGERYCSYDRCYRKHDQNIYDCKGFIYVGRAVVTEICSVLNVRPCRFFSAFDAIKEKTVCDQGVGLLNAYCEHGPKLADMIHNAVNKNEIARLLMNDYVIPFAEKTEAGDYTGAINLYKKMLKCVPDMCLSA